MIYCLKCKGFYFAQPVLSYFENPARLSCQVWVSSISYIEPTCYSKTIVYAIISFQKSPWKVDERNCPLGLITVVQLLEQQYMLFKFPTQHGRHVAASYEDGQRVRGRVSFKP
ncbi:hypothetical protein XENOCAPTIV_018950 [Xenoophorus captivus]|uniref:Uncharacterized protein n=1 Tax=Xenoophorus captivus TaxID=1517983 RepID=A0ABV0QTE8_9TELE